MCVLLFGFNRLRTEIQLCYVIIMKCIQITTKRRPCQQSLWNTFWVYHLSFSKWKKRDSVHFFRGRDFSINFGAFEPELRLGARILQKSTFIFATIKIALWDMLIFDLNDNNSHYEQNSKLRYRKYRILIFEFILVPLVWRFGPCSRAPKSIQQSKFKFPIAQFWFS